MANLPDAGTISLEQLGMLNQNVAGALAPFNNYSQNLLAMAVQKKARESQQAFDIAQQQRQQTFQAAQAEKLQAFNLKLEQAANDAAVRRQQAEWQHADETKKNSLLTDAETDAAKLGIDTKAIKGTVQERYFQIQGLLNKAHSDTVSALIKSGVELDQQLSSLTGVNPQQVNDLAKKLLLQDEGVARDFAADAPAIMADSGNITKIMSRLSASKKAADKEKLAELVSKWNSAQAAAEEYYAKNSPHREQVALIQAQKQQQRALLESQLRGTDLSVQTVSDMFSGVHDAVNQMQQQQEPDNPVKRWMDAHQGHGTTDAITRPAPPPQIYRQPGILSNVGPAISALAQPVIAPVARGAQLFRAGTDQLLGDLFGQPTYPTSWYTNPQAAGNLAAPVIQPPQQNPPSSTATYSLLNWLMRNQQMRNQVSPLAAPPVSMSPTNSPIAIDF